MPGISVISVDYGAELKELIAMKDESFARFYPRENGGYLACGDECDLAGALYEMIMKWLRPLETARLTALLPLSESERRELLPCVLKLTESTDQRAAVLRELSEYLGENELFIPEGFVRFRLPFLLEEWAGAAFAAAEELRIEREYESLLTIAEYGSRERSFASFCEMDMILYDDGSFVLTDGAGSRIDCDVTGLDAVIKLLASLLPEKLTVYDLTGGADPELMRRIKTLFGNRVRIFVRAE